MNRARALVDNAHSVVVSSGAGISTDSGLPDLRGPHGAWTKDPAAEKASSTRFHVGPRGAPGELDPSGRRRGLGRCGTNIGHHAIVHVERCAKLHAVIIQNVDELHRRAGSDPVNVVEIHGTTRKAGCLSCDWCADTEVVLDRVAAARSTRRVRCVAAP